MSSKIASGILVFIGIALLVLAFLHTMGIFTIVDVNPPKVLYTYPMDAIIPYDKLTEVVVYVQDDTEGIDSVTYYDNKYTNGLTLHRGTENDITHRILIPDVNDDGAVDTTDAEIVQEHCGAMVGDPNYDVKYDVYPLGNPDGIINQQDLYLIANYCYTYIFWAPYEVTQYTIPVSMNYTIIVYDKGLTTVVEGCFFIFSTSETLQGNWYYKTSATEEYTEISKDTTSIIMNTTVIYFRFVSDVDLNATVYALVNGKERYDFTKTASRTWDVVITVKGTNTVNLVAFRTDEEDVSNIMLINVMAPSESKLGESFDILTISLVAVGSLLIIVGLILAFKRRESIYL